MLERPRSEERNGERECNIGRRRNGGVRKRWTDRHPREGARERENEGDHERRAKGEAHDVPEMTLGMES